MAFLTTAWLASIASAADWQCSVPMEKGRAFLWIPPNCERVRGVVVGQNNMLEAGILEHPHFRQTLAELGIAEVFIAPPFDQVFQFDRGAGEKFEAMLRGLPAESGYDELAATPVVPIGHSACASFPWNFAAWNPQRTLAIVSVKGDAPQTDLTGSGHPNPAWGSRSIDGIPALMVMSEYEWWDARLVPAMNFRAAHPAAPIALLADVGHSHFDASDALVDFLAEFIRKAANARIQGASGGLKPVDPAAGWLVDRWRGDAPLQAPAAPSARYTGNRAEAFWCFDAEMAQATEAYYSASRGKRAQQVDFVQKGTLAPISSAHAGVQLAFEPEVDGVTFQVQGTFVVPLPPKPPIAAKDKPPPVTTIVPKRAADGTHAIGPVLISRVTGPVVQIAPDTFRLAPNRAFLPGNPWSNDIWLIAANRGDATYKSTVQQGVMKLPVNRTGNAQRITFAPIADQNAGVPTVALHAVSSAGPDAVVRFYVREGPAEVDGTTLRFTAIPPRAKFPVKVTVVAWQLGRSLEPKLQTAESVEQTFLLRR